MSLTVSLTVCLYLSDCMIALHFPEFPSQKNSYESVPEVRMSRAAVMAPEPIHEDLEITQTRVKKTVG